MICWRNFSIEPGRLRLTLLLLGMFLIAPALEGCAGRGGSEAPPMQRAANAELAVTDASRTPFRIAVLPLENLSAGPAPLRDIGRALRETLLARGACLLEKEELGRFMARHRVRHTGGIDEDLARAFREELDVDGVLISSLELYATGFPPRFALISRLTRTGPDEPATIAWIDSVALSGDDSPGLLDLGLVHDIETLQGRALNRLADSLVSYLRGDVAPIGKDDRFPPRTFYRSQPLNPEIEYRLAVLPFTNQSERREVDRLISLHFIRELHERNYTIVDPGVLRRELLQYRIIIPEGASLDTADLLFGRVGVDLLVTGRIMEYQDVVGSEGAPSVCFSSQFLERKSRKVVAASQSDGRGDKKVFFFDAGRIATAHELAARMVRATAERLSTHEK